MVAKLPYDIERDLQPVTLVTTGSPGHVSGELFKHMTGTRRDSAKWAEVVRRSRAKID